MTRGILRRTFPAILLLVPAQAGCSLLAGDDVAGAERVADQVAVALTTREVAEPPIDGLSQERLDTVLPATLAAAVEVDEVTVDGDSARARYTWTWETPGEPWTYETVLDLDRVEDAWQGSWDPALVEPSLTGEETLDVSVQRARRGDVVGAGGEPVVADRPVVRFGIDKTKVGARRAVESARALAAEVGVEPAPYADRVRAAGAAAFVEAIVLREQDAREVDVTGIPGAVGLGTEMPLAPTREFAAPLLGRVGEATAEIIEQSDGEVRAGDVVGISGLQQRYDDRLGGEDGLRVQAVGGEDPRVLFEVAPVDGEPLELALDVSTQALAEQVLSDVGPASAIVVLEPSTGEVLAAASGPGSEGQNTATAGQYAPGSTFKLATALALLRSGIGSADTLPCTPTVTVDGREFENYDDYPPGALGDIGLRAAVANSCNTALISQHARLGDGVLAEAAAALGLGVDHDLGFPAYFGQVPPPESETTKAASLIGQGQVLASPLAMAAVAASVQQGRAVLPVLLPDHEVEQSAPERPLGPDEAATLRRIFRAVVAEGTASFLADVPGPPLGAKTGTAEYGTEAPPRTHAWMVAAREDLAVAVFVEDGQSGSVSAGPLLEELLRRVSPGPPPAR